jgi:hypothetical protein
MENAKHLFSQCAYTKEVIRILLLQNTQPTILTPSFRQGMYEDNILNRGDIGQKRMQITCSFVLWRERCARIFRQQYKNEEQLAMEIMYEFSQ